MSRSGVKKDPCYPAEMPAASQETSKDAPKHRVNKAMLLMILHAIKLAHSNEPSLNRTLGLLLLATAVQEVIFWYFGIFSATIHTILKDGMSPALDPALRAFFLQFILAVIFVGAVLRALPVICVLTGLVEFWGGFPGATGVCAAAETVADLLVPPALL